MEIVSVEVCGSCYTQMYLKGHKIKQYIDILDLIVMHGENKFGTATFPCLQLLIYFAFLKKEEIFFAQRPIFWHHKAKKKGISFN